MCSPACVSAEDEPSWRKIKTKKKKKSTLGTQHLAEVSQSFTLIRMKYSLGLHELIAHKIFVSLVGTTNTSAVDTPALLCVVALLGPEFAVVFAVWVVDAIIVHKGRLVWLSSNICPCGQTLFSPVHLSLHQEAFGDH